MLIDTHAHLQHARYANDLEATLTRAAAGGVTAVIVPGSTLEDSRAAVALAERYRDTPCALYAAVGIHPTNAASLTASTLAELRELAGHPRVVAIGEIGLDDYWPHILDRGWPCAEPPQQRAALEAQLTLAAEWSLPVILHDRDAHADILDILRTWMDGHPERRGTLHAYAGGPTLLAEALALNLVIGMDGPVTFEKATELHEVARQVPLDRLLLETDAPYLTPHPYRGQRNEPAYLPYIAGRIAGLRGMAVETLAAATTGNAQRLFRLSALTMV
ncbi:MAG TPA: TatD family hydrolase [Anaerolineae bacterium]|nr:TatD family hydrolase [Anaerolineae bacterium]HQH38921.1 TatD family hydrolase [Anaerolineae bacterium]